MFYCIHILKHLAKFKIKTSEVQDFYMFKLSPICFVFSHQEHMETEKNRKAAKKPPVRKGRKSKGKTSPKDRKSNVSPITIDDDCEMIKGTDTVEDTKEADQTLNKSNDQTTPKDRKNNVSPLTIDDDCETVKGTDSVENTKEANETSNKSRGKTTPKDRKNNASPISIDDDDDCDSSETLKSTDNVKVTKEADQTLNKSKGQTTPKDRKNNVSPITIDDDDCGSSEIVMVKDNMEDIKEVGQSSNKSQIKEMSESNLGKTEGRRQTPATNEGRSSRHKTNKQTTEQTLDTRRNTEVNVSPSEAESCSMKKKEIVSQCNLAKESEVIISNTNKSKLVNEDNLLALKSDEKTKVIKNSSNESSNSPKINNPEMHTKDVKSIDSVTREQSKGGLVTGTEKDKLRIANTSPSKACAETAQASDEDVFAIDKNETTENRCPPNTSKKEHANKTDAGVSKSDAETQKAVPTKSSALGVDNRDQDLESKTKAVVNSGEKTEVGAVGKGKQSDVTHKTATKSSVRCAEDSSKECKGISGERLKSVVKKDNKEDMDSKDDVADSSGSSEADKEGTSEKVKDSTKTSELAKNGDKGNDNEPSSANIIKETCKTTEKTINKDKDTGKPQSGKVEKPEKSKGMDKSSKESSNKADGSIIKEPVSTSTRGLEESSKAVEHPDKDDGLEGMLGSSL